MSAMHPFSPDELLNNHQALGEHWRKQGYEPVAIPHPLRAGVTIYVAGEPSDLVDVTGPQCWTCDDRGFITPSVPVGDPRHGQAIPCPENCAAAQTLRRERDQKLFAGARLPKEYRDCTLLSFSAILAEQPDLWPDKVLGYRAIEAFIAAAQQGFYVDFAEIADQAGGRGESDWRNSLILSGPFGVGKTGLTASAVNGIVPQGAAVRYARTMVLLDGIQNRYRENWFDHPLEDDFGDLEAGNIVDLVCRVEVLVLDDFDYPGLKPDSDKAAKMQQIMRDRHDHQRATLVNTNLKSMAEINARWGEVTGTVMGRMAHFIPVGGLPLRPVPQVMARRD